MTKKQTMETMSRIAARKKMKKLYPYLLSNPDNIVHHVDHNPMNNDLSNLSIIPRDVHTIYHLRGIKKGIRKDTLMRNLKKIESLIYLHNEGIWI